ncbi:MAG: ATP-binding cassette domain-containing protein [Pseudomonadales bacterium]|nr:ATP-binding cassette domain-containing protein [Pseudomonadales bacterium]
MITLKNISLWRGDNEIFTQINLAFHPGHRVGIFGRNGTGKSTLFALITGQLGADEGNLNIPSSWKIAHLQQDTPPVKTTALNWVLDGDTVLRKLESQIEQATEEEDHDQLAQLYSKLEDIDGYTASARAAEILNGLGFAATEFDKPYSEFSGGWRIRLNLAQTLMCPSDLLLLDEPTNHLDLVTTLWLETWLLRYSGTVLVIAHDRDFLNTVSTHIAHLANKSIKVYRGNFENFERVRSEQLLAEEAAFNRQSREIKHMQKFIDRFRAKATKAKQAQSRLKALDRMTLLAPAYADSPYQFSFPNPSKLPQTLLSIEKGKLGYGDTVILDDVKLELFPGSRTGILGSNGTGKSTLVKILADEMPPISGKILRNSRYNKQSGGIGYFAQHQIEQLDSSASALELFYRIDQDRNTSSTTQALRNYLGGWGFAGDMATRPCEQLSGGERARLVLSLIAWQKPAMLLLDEPTNHLDLDMRHALAIALQDYEGALILVSHDRHLMGQVADEFLVTENGNVKYYRGDLESYTTELKTQKAPQKAPAKDSGSLSKREKRRLSANSRTKSQTLRNNAQQKEKQIAKLTKNLQQCTDQLADPKLYTSEENKIHNASQNSEAVHDLTLEQSRLKADIAKLEDEWIALQEQLQKP